MSFIVELVLESHDFPVDEVYRKIGLKGKKEHLLKKPFQTISGDIYIREEQCSITYSTECFKTMDIKEPIEKFCEILYPVADRIADCINCYDLSAFFCIAVTLTDNPIIELPYEFIKLASIIKAPVVFDTYI